MGELILNKPLLPGKSEMEQIHKTFSLVGTPTAENWPKHTDLPNLNKVSILLVGALTSHICIQAPAVSSCCGFTAFVQTPCNNVHRY